MQKERNLVLCRLAGDNTYKKAMPDEDEIQQVRAAQQGDLNALAALVTRHQQAVRACLAARLDDPHEAEDLVQEVFVTAFRKLGEFDPERPLAPWLRSIAMNLLRNHWRKFRPHRHRRQCRTG